MQAVEAARKAPVTVAPETTLSEVARIMDEQAVGAVVVVQGRAPVGIATDRDLVVRGLARQLPPDARVDGLMSSDLVTLDATSELPSTIRWSPHRPVVWAAPGEPEPE